MKRNRKTAGIVFLLLVGCLSFWFHDVGDPYRLEVIQSNDGYGYKLYEGKRTIIVQPFIPAIAGKEPFHTREDAQRIGNLVMERVKAGDNFSISKADLNNFKITY